MEILITLSFVLTIINMLLLVFCSVVLVTIGNFLIKVFPMETPQEESPKQEKVNLEEIPLPYHQPPIPYSNNF